MMEHRMTEAQFLLDKVPFPQRYVVHGCRGGNFAIEVHYLIRSFSFPLSYTYDFFVHTFPELAILMNSPTWCSLSLKILWSMERWLESMPLGGCNHETEIIWMDFIKICYCCFSGAVAILLLSNIFCVLLRFYNVESCRFHCYFWCFTPFTVPIFFLK